MISLIIDLLLIGIIVYCGWRGLKRGLVVSAFGVFAVVLSLFLGNLFGIVYSDQFSSMLKPFANGLVDGAITTVTAEQNSDSDKEPVVVLSETEKSDVYSVSFAALRELGIGARTSEKIANEVAADNSIVNQDMALSVSSRLCAKMAYILVTGIVFIIFAIIAAIIGNVLNLYFKLPNLEKVNKISGAVLGAVKGLLLVMFIACFCSYFGLLLSNKIISGTVLLEWFINHNKLSTILGL